jgi:predicted neuraminidase
MLSSFVLSLVVLTSVEPYDFALNVPSDVPVASSSMVCPEGGPYSFSHGSTLVELADGTLFCAWYAGSREKGNDVSIVGSMLPVDGKGWEAPQVLIDTPDKSEGNPVLFVAPDGVLWLFYQTMYGSGEGRTKQGTGWTTCKVKAITSTDGAKTWSDERILIDELGFLTRNKPVVLDDGTIVLPIHDERNWSSRALLSKDNGATWTMSAPIDTGLGFHDGNIEPALLKRDDGSLLCLMRAGGKTYRTWKSVSVDGGQNWTKPVVTEIPNPDAALDLLRLESGNVLMALNPEPEGGRRRLSLWLSGDEGESWAAYRDVEREREGAYGSYPALIQGRDGRIHMTYSRRKGGVKHRVFNEAWVWEANLLKGECKVANTVPQLGDTDDPHAFFRREEGSLPLKSGDIEEHVGTLIEEYNGKSIVSVQVNDVGELSIHEGLSRSIAEVTSGGLLWGAPSDGGLVYTESGGKTGIHPDYGMNGPLATKITTLAVDANDTLWVGTPLGISLRDKDGVWSYLRGEEGLPYEDVTDIEFSSTGDIWIGTTKGVILYRPEAKGRQWFYRQGPRYVPDDQINDLAVSADGKTVYVATPKGVGRIDLVTTTLLERAETIEKRVNQRHRRYGLVAGCNLDDARNPTSYKIGDNDNDGLWSAYHVAAMSLAYAVTSDEAAKESAKETMHAVIMLQNASGIPGLVARSVVSAEEGKGRNEQWLEMPDGRFWKSDTSNDEIDGHYMAFYTYWRHIAQFDPEERKLIEKQVRDCTDYIVDNNYQLIDHDGERTRWGFWNPENLNDDPTHILENGLGSLQICSFLKTAYYITGDQKYKTHYDSLLRDNGYLNNILLQKKIFPDSNNHSDNQLGCVAWYPILQLEWDPQIRKNLHKSARRHYKTLARDNSSFFNFVLATIDPHYVSIEGGLQNLIEIPTDRRSWGAQNSHRSDLVFDPRVDRFGVKQLLQVLPADERNFNKWNGNPLRADGGGGGAHEDDGSAYLLPYWMGRYHRFIE